MACYIVNYDLRKPGRDYTDLYDKIKSYSTWAHITESMWAVVSSKTAHEIYDDLAQVIDSNDALFVVRSGREATWHNVLCPSQWLKDNL